MMYVYLLVVSSSLFLSGCHVASARGPRTPVTEEQPQAEAPVVVQCPASLVYWDRECCWRNQVWSRVAQACVGVPECPEGMHVEAEACVADPESLSRSEVFGAIANSAPLKECFANKFGDRNVGEFVLTFTILADGSTADARIDCDNPPTGFAQCVGSVVSSMSFRAGGQPGFVEYPMTLKGPSFGPLND